MKEAGYVTCESDEAEKSYVLRFADNCKWVTITSEDYEQGNQTALNDTSRIAKMLNTSCVNITVIDSDCSVMELFDENGNKADTLIIGRADDYFGDSISLPSEGEWKFFLSDGSSWEKLCEIVKNSDTYVFIEDGLSDLAPLIGMDERNITFSFDEASEDENTIYLSFKFYSSKIEKKLTLKDAFIQVFGDTLEKSGYKKAKGANPYYVRVINDEIIHVITIENRNYAPDFLCFVISGNVLSVYNRLFDISKKPEEMLLPLNNFKVYSFSKHKKDYHVDYQKRIYNFTCKNNNKALMSEMNNALLISKELLIPFVESINSLESLFNYLLLHYPQGLDSRHEFLYLKVDNYADLLKSSFCIGLENYKKCLELKREEYTEEKYVEKLERTGIVLPQWISEIDEIRNVPELYNDYKNKEQKYRDRNIRLLKEYNII